MIILKRLEKSLQTIWEGIVRLFSSSDNDDSNFGVQPFSGDPYDERPRSFNK